MVCYLFFYPLFRVSKQKNSNPNHCSLRSFHNHPKLQNGPFWFRFSAATVVFSCGNCWCRACWRHNLQVFCPPRCYPDTYVSWLAPNMPGNLPGIASGRSNKENHGKKKKGTPRFPPMIPTFFSGKGFQGFLGSVKIITVHVDVQIIITIIIIIFGPSSLSSSSLVKTSRLFTMLSTPSSTFTVCTWFPAGVWKVKNMAGCGSKGVRFKWFFMCLFMLHSPKLTYSPLKIGLLNAPKRKRGRLPSC